MGPIEPFNGRRGSFRSGSHSSGPQQSSFAARNNARSFGQQQHHHQQVGSGMAKMTNRQSADPFNDLFDHYKSSGGGLTSLSGGSRPRLLHKQTSLDYNQLRNNSPRHQVNHEQSLDGTAGRSQKQLFRMSSLDHAEEHQRNHSQSHSPPESNSTQQQQQFRHLVTSGEDLQRQAVVGSSQRELSLSSGGQVNAAAQPNGTTLTPTDSSYILPQSTGSSYFNNQTPSPSDGQSSSMWSPQQAGGGQFYAGANNPMQQQQQQGGGAGGGYMLPRNYNTVPNQYGINGATKQRDVHSLADEQLYLAGRRIHNSSTLDRTDYTNYDFAISSSPKLSRRCMRRTASLSRNTPIKSSGPNRNPINQFGAQLQLQSRRSPSPAISIGVGSPSRINSGFQGSQVTGAAIATPSVTFDDEQAQHLQANHNSMSNHPSHDATSNSSHLTLDSSSASSGALLRKPSLQVRYDPLELGGLMSREEVAALSHAQREQRRIEVELAEKRARRPLLHLYLSTLELLSRQRLLVSVIIVNLVLFKLFADLIV